MHRGLSTFHFCRLHSNVDADMYVFSNVILHRFKVPYRIKRKGVWRGLVLHKLSKDAP